jgi:hypothetical protein
MEELKLNRALKNPENQINNRSNKFYSKHWLFTNLIYPIINKYGIVIHNLEMFLLIIMADCK